MPPLKLISCQARNTFPLMQALADYLQTRLGMPALYEDHAPWQERFRQIHTGEVQVGWICSKPYAEQLNWEPRPLVGLAVPIMTGALYAGQPVYYSYLVVHRDHPARSLSDLAGSRVAYNEPNSQSGYYSLLSALAEIGAEKGFFGEWVASGAHLRSLKMLQARSVDTAAIDATLWDYELSLDPHCFDSFKIIGTIGPFPAPPLVAHASLTAALRQQLIDILLNLHHEPEGRAVLNASLMTSFVPIADDFYRPLAGSSTLSG